MATRSEVATHRDIDISQELQDRGIRKEFQTMRIYMDKRFELVDKRFELVDERFKEQRSYMDDRFQQVEALMMNSKAASSWHDIVPIKVLNPHAEPQNRYQIPSNFPNKVIKFWRLQRPRDQHRLVELLRFYGIRASDVTTPISEDNDDEESESPLESQSTLEEAVKANPAFALARLAIRLGLDYGSISHNMGLYEQIQDIRAQQAAQRAKREQSSEEDKKNKDVERPAKKAATSPDILPHRSNTGIPLEELIAHPDSFSYKSPTPQSYVAWAPRPKDAVDSPTSRTSGSSSKKRTTTPSEPSKGPSTIPFTQQSGDVT
jgi:hypothetical protein